MDSQVKTKPRLRWLRRIVVTMVAVPLVLLMLLDAVLSDRILQLAVDRFAAPYVDGTLAVGRIKASALRNFPNFRLELHDVTVGDDTLAHADLAMAAIHVMDAVRGEINLPQIRITGLRVNAHRYDSTVANWDIFRFQSDTSQSSPLPEIQFGKVSIDGTAQVIYTDCVTGLAADLKFNELTANGRFDAELIEKLYALGGRPEKHRIKIDLDGLELHARMAGDSLAFSLDHLALHEHGDHVDLAFDSELALKLRDRQLMTAPLTLDTEIGFPPSPEGALASFDVLEFNARVAALPLELSGWADLYPDRLDMDIAAKVEDCSVGEIFDEYVRVFLPFFKYLQTDACISLEAEAHGTYCSADGRMPAVSLSLAVPDSHFSYSNIIDGSEFDMTLRANMDTAGRISADLEDFCFDMDGLSLNVKGRSDDLLAADPMVEVDGRAHVGLEQLVAYLPAESGIAAGGNVDLEVAGHVRPSQLSLYKLNSSDLKAVLRGDRVMFAMPGDTLYAQLWQPSVKLEGGRYVAAIDTLSFSLGDALRAQGSKLRAQAVNSPDTLASGLPQCEIALDANAVDLQSGDDMEVMLRGSRNHFSLRRGAGGIPVMKAATQENALILNLGDNRILLRNAALDVNTRSRMPRRQERPAARVRFAPDSANLVQPDFLSEADFRLKDINLKLDSSLLELYRRYNPYGSLSVGTAKIVTPMLPLRLSADSLSLDYTDNTLTLNSLGVSAGTSSMSASGSLTGLRRAFQGRGVMDLDMDVQSSRLNANELIAAFQAGAADTLSQRNTIADNREYQNSIVIDTLENAVVEGLNYPLIVVPANLNAKVRLDIAEANVSQFAIKGLSTDMTMRERTVQLLNTMVLTDVGNASLDAFYATVTKKDIRAGFNLGLKDVTADKVIDLFPVVDSLVPMLKSFKGNLDLEMAATTQLDTNMNVVLPSIDGIVKLEGKDLLLEDTGDLRRIAQLLMFKDARTGHISDLAMYGIISNNKLEVYPFLLGVDRYTMALDGLQQFDSSFKYHISLLDSPLPFRFGLNLLGNFDDWNYTIGRPKYRTRRLPQMLPLIEAIQNSLSASIRNIFTVGVDGAMSGNARARREAQRQGEAIIEDQPDELLDAKELVQLDSLMLDYEIEQEREALEAEIEALFSELEF